MQQTSFDYELVILDDYSTDRTREIVTAYRDENPDKIRLILAEVNRCDNSAFLEVLRASQSPYFAILDGDDYWTDPHKLQKQADYLDQNPACAISFHNVGVLSEDSVGELSKGNPTGQKEISNIDDLLDGCFIYTCSALIRRGAIRGFPSWYVDDVSADWSLFCLAALGGSVHYLNESMAVYRKHHGGFWTGQPQNVKYARIARFYENISGCLSGIRAEKATTELAKWCYQAALEYEQRGDAEAARQWLRKGLAASPDPRILKWSLRTGPVSAASIVFPPEDRQAVRVAIATAGDHIAFDIQLNYPNQRVSANRRYTVRFQSRADRPRDVFLGFAKANEPWTGLGLYTKIPLISDWRQFEMEFVVISDETNGRLHFDAGESDIAFEVSNVSLRDSLTGLATGPGLLP